MDHAVRCDAVWCDAVWCVAVRCDAVWCVAVGSAPWSHPVQTQAAERGLLGQQVAQGGGAPDVRGVGGVALHKARSKYKRDTRNSRVR